MLQQESDPPCEFRFGSTQILPWLWLGGEEDVDEPLRVVDVWIDFRDETPWNRKIKTPNNVLVIHLPFSDGDKEKVAQVLPFAKTVVDDMKRNNKKVLISCHAGVSRSALLAWWCLSDEIGFDEAWCEIKAKRPHVEPHENFYEFIYDIKSNVKGSPIEGNVRYIGELTFPAID